MALTADDVRNVVFRKAPFGRRGYDEEEVDAFLSLIETTIAELQARLAGLDGDQRAAPESAVRSELDQITQRLSRIEAALGARLTTD
jgi:DivIVA domain-containing protein